MGVPLCGWDPSRNITPKKELDKALFKTISKIPSMIKNYGIFILQFCYEVEQCQFQSI